MAARITTLLAWIFGVLMCGAFSANWNFNIVEWDPTVRFMAAVLICYGLIMAITTRET